MPPPPPGRTQPDPPGGTGPIAPGGVRQSRADAAGISSVIRRHPDGASTAAGYRQRRQAAPHPDPHQLQSAISSEERRTVTADRAIPRTPRRPVNRSDSRTAVTADALLHSFKRRRLSLRSERARLSAGDCLRLFGLATVCRRLSETVRTGDCLQATVQRGASRHAARTDQHPYR